MVRTEFTCLPFRVYARLGSPMTVGVLQVFKVGQWFANHSEDQFVSMSIFVASIFLYVEFGSPMANGESLCGIHTRLV